MDGYWFLYTGSRVVTLLKNVCLLVDPQARLLWLSLSIEIMPVSKLTLAKTHHLTWMLACVKHFTSPASYTIDIACRLSLCPLLLLFLFAYVYAYCCTFSHFDLDHTYAIGSASKAALLYKTWVEKLLAAYRELHEENDKLRKENSHLVARVADLESRLHVEKSQKAQEKVSTAKKITCFEEFIKDERRLQFYTGFTSLQRFYLFVQFLAAKHA